MKAVRERTGKRNEAVWLNWDTTGLAAPLESLEAILNQLGDRVIRQFQEIVDEEAAFKAEQRDKLHNLELAEAAQRWDLAQQKYLTQIQVLALKKAGEEYLLSAREYDNFVQSLIMAAREYAAEVEREEIALQRSRAKMDIKKAEAHLKEVQASILLEIIQRRHVEIEVARAKVDAAKAAVRAVLAGIEAQEAELKVIQVNLDVAMAEVERATLMSDIALIYADILTRHLAEIRYEVEYEELEAAFKYVQWRLEDLLGHWETRTLEQEARRDCELKLLADVALLLLAQKAQEDLAMTRQNAGVEVFAYEKDKVDGDFWQGIIHEFNAGGLSEADRQEIVKALEGRIYQGGGMPIELCRMLKVNNVEGAEDGIKDLKHEAALKDIDLNKAAKIALAIARKAVAQFQRTYRHKSSVFSQVISKGFFSTTFPTFPAEPVTADLSSPDLSPPEIGKQVCDEEG